MGTRPLLQLLAIFVVLLSSSRGDDNSTASIRFPLPSNCTTNCGDITFHYPFGIGDGCFRPGFALTCNTTTDPPKLFLGNKSSIIEVVGDIRTQNMTFSVKAPVAFEYDNVSDSYTPWAALANSSFYLPRGMNYFYVAGRCNWVGSLVDLTSNETLATCNITCNEDTGQTYSCSVEIERDVQSFGVRLSQIPAINSSNSNVTVTIREGSRASDLIDPHENPDVDPDGQFVLKWNINDQLSCKEAENERTSYACLSLSSKCTNVSSGVSAGYWCECPDHVGNPFLPHGCLDDVSANVLPSSNCASIKCGNISVPFPFGLEEGCYRDETFALTCDETSNPPVLVFSSRGWSGRVTNFMVDEGNIEVTSVHNFEASSSSGSLGLNQDRVIYQWAIYDQQSCWEAQGKLQTFACRSVNSRCVDTTITSDFEANVIRNNRGYSCKCLDGFEGNPYVSDGCKDIDECEKPNLCYGKCVNTFGSYTCTCPSQMHGDPRLGPCISSGLLLGVIIGVSTGFGIILLAITLLFATWKWNKVSKKRARQRHFHENHGLLLQQFIASNEDIAEKVKIFSLEELEKATNKFDSSKILGQGGHGTVYKGILSDQRVVAIKRSKIQEKSEIIEFLNEITILSQINHRNIVKLYGCCLESEIPLLVYECISNGTLFHHLHSPNNKSKLSWGDRLRIAAEAARALEYLHSYASISIFHRDMKSSNILLDDYYTAKVSDFGASRLIPLEKTHIFTAIQGTFGYLDPEYYQTCQLTEKSDVYSFGVILLELLTGEKPISFDRNEEERNLVVQFLHALRENRHFELIETQIMEEGKIEEIDKVARLAEMCLKLKGSERPTMTKVEIQLRCLQKAKLQQGEKGNANGNKEIVPLLRDISFSPFSISPIVQSSSPCTRNYSLEREMISSMKYPR